MTRTFCSIFVIAVLAGPLPAQELSTNEKEILLLQDQRLAGDQKLYDFLKDAEATVRFRTCIAFANLQDTSSAPSILRLLGDPDAQVRKAAAFALGQIGSNVAQRGLTNALNREKDLKVSQRILEALGRCGDHNALDSVITFVPESGALRREQAISVARFALRNIKSEREIWFCFGLLNQQDPDVQWRALYALWRSQPHGLIDVEISKRREELEELARSSSLEVRMNLATLLGRSKSSDATHLLHAIAGAENTGNSWRVEVQLVRGYGAFAAKDPTLLDRIATFLSSLNENVKIAALQVITQLPKGAISGTSADDLRAKLKNLAELTNGAVLVQGEALVALGKHFPDDLTSYSSLMSRKSSNPLLRAKYLEGLSFSVTPESFETFLQALNDESVRVSMGAWDFIKRQLNPEGKQKLSSQYKRWNEISAILQEKVHASLAKKDMAITTLIAEDVADSSFFSVFTDTGYSASLIRDLMNSYSDFSNPDGVEAIQAILRSLGSTKSKSAIPLLEEALKDADRTVAQEAATALQKITGQDYSRRIPKSSRPKHFDFDWQGLESITPGQKLVMRTSRGLVAMELLKDAAPFTVLSFVKLAKQGFFDGLNFHRVVPNFVVQGGDPRGDGWGGPGYAIRSEFGLVNYERGSVGVASAGKDTEGCQFFITHSPQPHLDGRYTIFAKVVAGMEVVDRLQVGDKILAMEVAN